MERTPRAISAAVMAATASAESPQPIDPARLSPASSPFEFHWQKFRAIAIPAGLSPMFQKALQHAFFAGGRIARQTMVEGLSEMSSDDPELAARGEERLASLEIEIEKYFTEAMRAAQPKILKP